MIQQRTKFLVLAATVAMAQVAQAHPGHPPISQGAAHFMTSPYHLAAGLVVGVGLWYAASFLTRRAPQLALRAAGAAVALGSLALWTAGA